MFQTLTDVAVEVGKNFFGVFEHGDRAAETTEDGGEFEPDDSGSNDTQFLGDMVDVEHFGRSEYAG